MACAPCTDGLPKETYETVIRQATRIPAPGGIQWPPVRIAAAIAPTSTVSVGDSATATFTSPPPVAPIYDDVARP